jgi:hypothetical protein
VGFGTKVRGNIRRESWIIFQQLCVGFVMVPLYEFREEWGAIEMRICVRLHQAIYYELMSEGCVSRAIAFDIRLNSCLAEAPVHGPQQRSLTAQDATPRQ